MIVDTDFDHPILDAPYMWELSEFTYHSDQIDQRESYIDLVFVRDESIRRLRFFGPRELEISCGLPNSCGLCILDVTGRQLEGIRVRVVCIEGSSHGVPRFWASHVVDLDTLK
jgi:hypothetical protein